MDADIPLVDTNLLIYVFDDSEPQKQKICKELVTSCWESKRTFAISLQNLLEFYSAATTKFEHPLDRSTALEFVKAIVDFENWKVLEYTSKTAIRAVELNQKYEIHLWDAMIAATMRENGILRIPQEKK